MQRFAEDPGVSRMLTRVPHPYPPGEAEGFIAEFGASPFETLPVRPFAITVAGEFAGVVALSNENGFAAGPIVLGYWLGRPYWGRGYASEATREVIGSYAFGALGADELFAGAFADNPASLRVLEKLGFERVGTSELHSLARGRAAPHVDMKLARARFFAAGSP
jgi:RimJ/RimL family protein N-acetyltransferase